MTTARFSFLLLPLFAAACSSGAGDDNTVTGDEEELVQGACSIVNGATGRAMSATARRGLDDPFFKHALAGGAGTTCPTTVKATLERLAASTKGEQKPFIVSERGDQPTNAKTSYRFVVVQTVDGKNDVLFLSMLGSKSGGVSQGFLEVMAFSEKRKGFLYYAIENGKWTLVGDGSTVVAGETPKFACVNCHTSGAPLMKELQDSWNNWNSIWFSMPDPGSSEETFKGLFAKKGDALALEKFFFSSMKTHAKAQVDRDLAAGRLKGLLKQVMCEVAEPNLVSSHTRNSTRFGKVQASSFMNFPPSILVSQLLKHGSKQGGYEGLIAMNLPSLNSVSMDGTAYSKALETVGQKIGGEPGDTMFGLSVPERGFVDNMVAEELVRRGLLDKDLVTDLLMTDFTVPAYSKVRCDLAATAPDKGANAEEIRTAWIANLEKSTLKGAKELLARMKDKADFSKHEAAVEGFLKACVERSNKDKEAWALDIVKIASQRRKEFHEKYHSLVESPDLLPTDNLTDTKPHAFRLNPTTCVLEKQ